MCGRCRAKRWVLLLASASIAAAVFFSPHGAVAGSNPGEAQSRSAQLSVEQRAEVPAMSEGSPLPLPEALGEQQSAARNVDWAGERLSIGECPDEGAGRLRVSRRQTDAHLPATIAGRRSLQELFCTWVV